MQNLRLLYDHFICDLAVFFALVRLIAILEWEFREKASFERMILILTVALICTSMSAHNNCYYRQLFWYVRLTTEIGFQIKEHNTENNSYFFVTSEKDHLLYQLLK